MIEFLNSYSNVFVAIASLGTFISSLIVLFTLFEMKRQRIVSLQPELILKESTSIEIYNSCDKENLLVDMFKWRNLNSTEYNSTYSFINLYNIGNGPAKSIEIKWVFDVQNFINQIKKRDTENLFSIKCLNDQNDSLLFRTECSLMHIEQNGFNSNFEFILPTSNNNSTIQVPVSMAFTTMYSILLFLVLSDESSFMNLEFNNIPGSKIVINYKDSQNNRYKREYQVNLTYSSVRRITNNITKDELMCSSCIVVK